MQGKASSEKEGLLGLHCRLCTHNRV